VCARDFQFHGHQGGRHSRVDVSHDDDAVRFQLGERALMIGAIFVKLGLAPTTRTNRIGAHARPNLGATQKLSAGGGAVLAAIIARKSMNNVLPLLLVTTLGAALVAACSKGFSRQERKWVTATFGMHVVFACVQVPLTLAFYGSSDMFLYFSYGEILAQMMERDPGRVLPEVIALLLRQPHHLPLTIIGSGTSTGSMSALAAASFYFLGPSKYATCVAFALLSLCGKIGIYRVFRANVGPERRFSAAVATLFIPSFVFWSSGLIKEAVAVAGFGWALYGAHLWIVEARPAPGWALMLMGAIPIWLIKPYILFPLLLAGGTWYYWARSLKRGRVRVRPLYVLGAGLLSVGGIVVLGQYFPEYAPEAFSAHAYELQQIGSRTRGGSNFALGGEMPTSLAGQFVFAPAALLTSLFRPAIFEVHNLLMLANALETTAFTLLFARVLLTRNLGAVRRQIMADPFFVFCVVFVITFGIAAGLASTNLGTLSRYRCPILPFFVMLLFVLQKPRRATVRAPSVGGDTRGVLRAA